LLNAFAVYYFSLAEFELRCKLRHKLYATPMTTAALQQAAGFKRQYIQYNNFRLEVFVAGRQVTCKPSLH
jgi:hypothetical protein